MEWKNSNSMNSSMQSSIAAKARAARLASTWIEAAGKICFSRRIAGIAVTKSPI